MILEKMFLLPVDRPTVNGRVYSKELMTKAVNDWNSRPHKVITQQDYNGSLAVDITCAIGTMENLIVEDDGVFGDIKLDKRLSKGEQLIRLVEVNHPLYFRLSGVGSVNEKNEVQPDYYIMNVAITTDENNV